MCRHWEDTVDLLRAGDYEQAAGGLEDIEQRYRREGNAALAHMVSVTRRICLACAACTSAGRYHQQVMDSMYHQLDELSGEVLAIAGLLGNLETSPDRAAPLQPAASKNGAREHSLTRRLQSLLGRTQLVASPAIPPAPPALNAEDAFPSISMDPAPPALAVCCLGPFNVYEHDQPVDNWPSRRGKSIFKYLVSHRKQQVPKDVLMDVFWPDSSPEAARNSLCVAIYGLRQALRPQSPNGSQVLFRDDCYLINPDLSIWVDVEAFVAHLQNARRLEEKADYSAAIHEYHLAETLYQGEFLEEDRYEEWPTAERAHLRESYLGVLDRLSRHYLERSDYNTSALMCRKMLAVEPDREEAHRRIMRCYAQQGQRCLALRQFQMCAEALRSELDVPPSSETISLYELIQAGKPLDPAAPIPPHGVNGASGILPARRLA
jgi:DNA-binding SARP family transcriptional activator